MWRKYESDLIHWRNTNPEKPLLVLGARQIGKTYTIQKFLADQPEETLFFNLELNRDIFNIFEASINPNDILPQIELSIGKKIDVEHTIFFFDEVQVSERFITSLKYFNESPQPFKIIAAGSLLGVKLNRFRSSFPVGKVDFLEMTPLNFEEFLLACGKDLLHDAIHTSFLEDKALIAPIHQQAFTLYQHYLLVGGMPEAVHQFVAGGQDIPSFTPTVIANIDLAYLADMKKYVISTAESLRNEQIYQSIPAQLAQETSRKFRYALLEKGGSKRKFESPLSWLLSSHILLACQLVKRSEVPIKVFADRDNFKLYLSDVGLLTYKAGLTALDILENKTGLFSGAIAENYVAQQFNSLSIPLYYWTSNNRAEIDFLMQTDEGIIPIEVKSGENTRSKSLMSYADKYKPAYSIRISAKNFGFENGIKSVPLYAVWCMGELKSL